MKHDLILNWFKIFFTEFSKAIESWSPQGANSIRIRMINRQEVVFTFYSQEDWRYESVNSFINHTIRED